MKWRWCPLASRPPPAWHVPASPTTTQKEQKISTNLAERTRANFFLNVQLPKIHRPQLADAAAQPRRRRQAALLGQLAAGPPFAPAIAAAWRVAVWGLCRWHGPIIGQE